jgi:hypothetical protein
MSDQLPILTRIEQGMIDKIFSISKAGGYYNDWGSVNELDTAKQIFPSAVINLDYEENIDSTDAAWNQAYNQEAYFIIRVRAALENEEEIPSEEIKKVLNTALEDLKRCFGRNYTLSDACDLIMYRGAERVKNPKNDIFRPALMDTRWLVKYTQLRSDPSQFI